MYNASSRCPKPPHVSQAKNLRKQSRKQAGAALILALMVVAIVATLAVQFADSFHRSVSRVENRWYGSTAQNYLEGAEALAAIGLQLDLENSETDNLQEDWAQAVPPFATDDGWLYAQLEDAQARFNLNNLDGNTNPSGPTATPAERFTHPQRAFIRLLQSFDDYPVSESDAIAIAEAVIDWIDEDDEPRGFGGAESLVYSSEEPPYQPNNSGRFNSVSELRLVRHMTPELYRRLEPLLVALPEATDINVNTAPAHLLRLLNNAEELQPLEAEDVQPLMDDREVQAYEKAEDFFSSPVLQNLAPSVNQSGYGVSSSYFILHARATVGEQERFATSLLHRGDEQVETLQRRFTSY